jgi:hypothetical protein
MNHNDVWHLYVEKTPSRSYGLSREIHKRLRLQEMYFLAPANARRVSTMKFLLCQRNTEAIDKSVDH